MQTICVRWQTPSRDMSIVEILAPLLIFLFGMGVGWLTSDDECESDGCNGHHWQDTEPVEGVSTATLADAGYDSPTWITSGYYLSTSGTCATLYQKAIKRCEDCGKVEKDSIKHGTLDVAERLGKR